MRDNNARTWRVLSTYTGMTCELSLLTVLLHCSITSMTRKLSYYTFQIQAWRVYSPISAQIGLVIANHVREFSYSFDWYIIACAVSLHQQSSQRVWPRGFKTLKIVFPLFPLLDTPLGAQNEKKICQAVLDLKKMNMWLFQVTNLALEFTLF